MSNKKFRKGQKVKVVKTVHGHHFPMGSIVKIDHKTDCDYYCTSEKGDWYLTDEELSPVKKSKKKTP